MPSRRTTTLSDPPKPHPQRLGFYHGHPLTDLGQEPNRVLSRNVAIPLPNTPPPKLNRLLLQLSRSQLLVFIASQNRHRKVSPDSPYPAETSLEVYNETMKKPKVAG
jgi:hypothetical protein